MGLLLDDDGGGLGTGSLTAFVRTAELGSFARAAVELGRTPSGIAKSVARLERRLGGALFARTTRKLSLTECGEVVLEHARRVLAGVAAAEAAIVAARSDPRGRLKVGAPHGLGRSLLLPSLPRFAAAYPDIRVELDLDGGTVDVIGGGYDVVLHAGAAPDSGLRARRVGRLHRILCAAPAYLARHGTPRRPGELAAHQCIRYRSPKSGRVEDWRLARDGQAAALPATFVFNACDAVEAAARAGLGIAEVSECSVADDLAAGRLVRVLDDCADDAPDGDVWLLWPPERHRQPKVRAFVDYVASLFPEAQPARRAAGARVVELRRR